MHPPMVPLSIVTSPQHQWQLRRPGTLSDKSNSKEGKEDCYYLPYWFVQYSVPSEETLA